ncbi:IS4 family transposase [Gloeobacter kilaueensis]|uniref:Transposase IS4-like domain-containing protein n=1 Tax=Gloeobacter kilaueensis (strain ATCC BAA-2537 / CCAP 1431/1 / ULC 316 / JS1) TaxID=1183438 RepID=U5QS64_GLOK1|nr:IS4 family transposase [Gloeobacter kilaueensis]AGY60464.1 hypothetical protein GKIL_4218 [Gloeobacter kilaueensis JS1]
MLPQFYQTFFRHLLTQRQYILLSLLLQTLQTHKHLCLGKLSEALPLPIQADSRKTAVQRFLLLERLNILEAWFPLVLYLVREYFSPHHVLKLAIDRTTWWHYNVLSVVLVWERHALPLHWILLEHTGNSDFTDQQLLLLPVFQLLSNYKLRLLADREFCSIELANWLHRRGVELCLRLRVSANFQQTDKEFVCLSSLNLHPGISLFIQGVRVTKRRMRKGFARFNIACHYAEQVRNMRPAEGWYILTNLPSLQKAIDAYKERWGIEVWHKDVKSGGYHLEGVRVSFERMMRVLLLAAIAWSMAMLKGLELRKKRLDKYGGRPQENQRELARHSSFRLGQYAQVWAQQVEQWWELLEELVVACPSKVKYYRRGMEAAKLILGRT